MTTMISNSNRTEIVIATTTEVGNATITGVGNAIITGVGNDAGSGGTVPVGPDCTDIDERWLFPARRI